MWSDQQANTVEEHVDQKVRLAAPGVPITRWARPSGDGALLALLPYAIGLACFYAWNLTDIYLFPVVPPDRFAGVQWTATVIGAICNATSYLLVALMLSKTAHFPRMADTAAILAGLTTLVTLILATHGAIGSDMSVALYRGVGRVFAAFIIVAWGIRYCTLDAHVITTLALSSFCIALLTCLVLAPLPTIVRGTLFAMLLPGSMVAYHLAPPRGGGSVSHDAGTPTTPHLTSAHAGARRNTFVADIWRVMVVFVLFGIITWMIMLDARAGASLTGDGAERLGIATIVGSLVIMTVLLVICLATQSTFTVSYISKLVLPLVFSGLLFAVAFNYYSGLSSTLVSIGYTCFDLFVFVLVASLCAKDGVRPGLAFGVYRAIESAVPLGALAFIDLRDGLFAAEDGTLVFVVSAICVLVLLTSALLDSRSIFHRAHLNPTINYPKAEAYLFADQCMLAIQRYELTKREAEVMSLVARGRSIPHIAERLSISRSTVKTYVARIYQKMGVTDRQEMLDAIEMISPIGDNGRQ